MPQRDVRTIARALRNNCVLETREIRDGTKSPLLSERLLIPAGTMKYWRTEDGDMPIFDHLGQICYADCAGMHTLAKSDVQLWKRDFKAIAKRLAECFECEDGMSEIKPERLMRLGTSSMPIGRRCYRAVYFADSATDIINYLRCNVVEKDNYIMIAGFADNVIFGDGQTDHVFKMEDVIKVDQRGDWSVKKDVLDSRFKQPIQPAQRKMSGAKQKKLMEIANTLKNHCFDYRHRYPELLELRKTMQSQCDLSKAFGISTSTMNDYLGNKARVAGENPVAFFWWDTLLDRDGKYKMFEAFLEREEIRHDIPKHMNMNADTLKEKIEKYLMAEVIKLSKRHSH